MLMPQTRIAYSETAFAELVPWQIPKPAAAMADFSRAWKSGKAEKAARIRFASPKLLWKVPTATRWELLKRCAAHGRCRFVKRPAGQAGTLGGSW